MTDAEARAAALAHDDAVTLLKRACVPSLPPLAQLPRQQPPFELSLAWAHRLCLPRLFGPQKAGPVSENCSSPHITHYDC